MSIRFRPHPVLGNQSLLDLSKKNDFNTNIYFLDIVCYIKGQSNDPFSTISRLYHVQISSRENNFFIPKSDPVASDEDPDKVEIELGFTLLPHQILIVPREFFDNLAFANSEKIMAREKPALR